MTINVEEYLKEFKAKEERMQFIWMKLQESDARIEKILGNIDNIFQDIRESDKLINQELKKLSDCWKNHKYSSSESDTSCSVSTK